MLYRVAQNKWDLLLKLCMGYFLNIKINYNGIVVSVCLFSMVKPVQRLLNMHGPKVNTEYSCDRSHAGAQTAAPKRPAPQSEEYHRYNILMEWQKLGINIIVYS